MHRNALQRLLYRFCELLSRIAGVLLFDVRASGASRVARRGPVVVAATHQSFLDPWLVGMCLPRPAYYAARDTLFRWPGFGLFIRSLNALPFPRVGVASRRGIDLARAVLRGGGALVLFPEGTRSRTGARGPLKRGLELIVRSLGPSVTPALIEGSFDAWPPQRLLPRLAAVRVFFARPFAAGRPAGGGPDGDRRNDGADLVPRLEASYRRLEARAREVRWAGSAGFGPRSHGSWQRYFG